MKIQQSKLIHSENEFAKQLEKIAIELFEVEKKFPLWPNDILYMIAIIQEELGESTKAGIDHVYRNAPIKDIKKELIQTTAMCIRTLIALDRIP